MFLTTPQCLDEIGNKVNLSPITVATLRSVQTWCHWYSQFHERLPATLEQWKEEFTDNFDAEIRRSIVDRPASTIQVKSETPDVTRSLSETTLPAVNTDTVVGPKQE